MPRTTNKRKKLHIKKGDRVMLNKTITSAPSAGEDREKGYIGKVLRVFPERERIIVEGVNMRVFHEKPRMGQPEGGRIEREAPIHASNVNPVDSNDNPTRIGRKKIEDPESGASRWVRYAKTTGEELDN
ncbi:50S ribosomal protein L24 [Salisaeta longa]|uniref:50S ribosomal protein L24 n=1 Tax=Salisaeta longa TaxID=503170 RepID=UPI0003B411FC|nr:50S ribosomal protein L24 [Salisaeta longa]